MYNMRKERRGVNVCVWNSKQEQTATTTTTIKKRNKKDITKGRKKKKKKKKKKDETSVEIAINRDWRLGHRRPRPKRVQVNFQMYKKKIRG